MGDEFELPSEEELRELPRFSVAVYALRCALRGQPLLTSWKDPTNEYVRAVIRLNSASKILVSSAPIDVNTAYAVYTDAIAAAKAANTSKSAIVAANAANAIYAAANALNSSFYYATAVEAADKANVATYLAYATSVATTTAARIDYMRLTELKTDVTDASETGPLGDLWHGSPPDWYLTAKEDYDKTIAEWERELGEENVTDKISKSEKIDFSQSTKLRFEQEKLRLEQEVVENEIPLEFYIDRGNASKEVVQEVFDAISNLSFAAGGFGYLFKNDGKSISIVPEEVNNDF